MLRIGAAAYAAVLVVSYLVPTGVGGTAVRLGGCVALPIVLGVCRGVRRGLAVLVVVPVLVLTWAPVWASATVGRVDDSTHATYYAPLVRFLSAHAQPAGRVEVIPTALHWEAVYVAATEPLARGWERQLDTLDNPIFYRSGALTGPSYLRWLRATGVRFVALPDAKLDIGGRQEAQLVERSPAGLVEVWHDPHWKVYAVTGSPGIIDGPGILERLTGQQLTVGVRRRGHIQIRVRPADRWTISSGPACLEPPVGDAVTIDARGPGTVTLELRAFGVTDSHADAVAC
jgi:hypothetical protein